MRIIRFHTEANVKESSKSKEDMKIEGEDAQIQIKTALLSKRNTLIEELRNIELAISQLKNDFSKKIEGLEQKKKFPEEGLQHIDALLKLEGMTINNKINDSIIHDESALNDTSFITNAVFNLLEEIHKPMHYQEITKKMQEKGIYIPGKNSSATLLSRINRDKRFKRTAKRGTYALIEWRVRAGKIRRRKRNKRKIHAN